MIAHIKLRPASLHDEAHYLRIESDAYRPEFLETAEAFRAKVQAFPEGCWFAEAEGTPIAYLICHPWNALKPPPLNPENFHLPANPTVFYLHSATIERRWQKRGIGAQLAQHAITIGTTHGFRSFALVSVQGSADFWLRCGYSVVENPPPLIAAGLAGYGPEARYMIRNLAPA